jgi:hypothetical protein
MKLPLEFTGNYWLFMVKISTMRCWVRNQGTVAEVWTRTTSRRLEGLSPQANSRRTYKKKSTNFSDSRCRELNICMARVNEIIAGLGYARPHTNAATTAAIANFHNLPTDRIWHQVSRNIHNL